MKAVIYKYELTSPISEIELPVGAKVLSVGDQGGHIQLWAQVDISANKEKRTFKVVPTGAEIDLTGCHHIGTIQQMIMGGPSQLVWHVFEQL